jgi:hypothetical protein
VNVPKYVAVGHREAVSLEEGERDAATPVGEGEEVEEGVGLPDGESRGDFEEDAQLEEVMVWLDETLGVFVGIGEVEKTGV